MCVFLWNFRNNKISKNILLLSGLNLGQDTGYREVFLRLSG
jgi:hypothetical protein